MAAMMAFGAGVDGIVNASVADTNVDSCAPKPPTPTGGTPNPRNQKSPRRQHLSL